MSRILGIDPGSLVTGWGVIDADRGATRFVACGTIRTTPNDKPASELAARLKRIHDEVRALCAEFRPDEIAVERVFVDKNAGSALKLGHARAAAICGSFGCGAAFHEYAPREIKQAVTGTGAATKDQVAHMVRALLGIETKIAVDASDALACALTHAHGRGPAALPAGVRIGSARRRVRAKSRPRTTR